MASFAGMLRGWEEKAAWRLELLAAERTWRVCKEVAIYRIEGEERRRETHTTVTEKRRSHQGGQRERETQRSQPPSTDLTLSAPAQTPATTTPCHPPSPSLTLFNHLTPRHTLTPLYCFPCAPPSPQLDCSSDLASISDRPAPNLPGPARTQ